VWVAWEGVGGRVAQPVRGAMHVRRWKRVVQVGSWLASRGFQGRAGIASQDGVHCVRQGESRSQGDRMAWHLGAE